MHFDNPNSLQMCLRPLRELALYLRCPSWIWEKKEENGMNSKISMKKNKKTQSRAGVTEVAAFMRKNGEGDN